MKATAPHAHGVTRQVEALREVGGEAFVVRMNRGNLGFEPGQYLAVGIEGQIDAREYSIYSSPGQEYLEILVKEVEEGYVSPRLHALHAGQRLFVDGPFGYFTIPEEQRTAGKFLFVATGTGISPFHCFALAYPQLDYRVLHGVRRLEDRYEMDVFDRARYTACVTREDGGDYRGRVTDYLREHPVDPDTLCYLCGNCDMIYEAFDILKDQGVSPEHLFAEVYF